MITGSAPSSIASEMNVRRPTSAAVYDVTRVALDGSLRANEASDRVEVVTGSFSIATSPASFGFTATAGQCVTSSDTVEPTTGALFTQWTVDSCN